MRLPKFLLVINANLPLILHRFRDIAFDRSKIAIFCYPFWVYLPWRRCSPGTISIKFSVHVNGWPGYQMPYKYCRKLQQPWVGCTSVTDDRQMDGRQHIANVNMSSRSLKTVRSLVTRTILERLRGELLMIKSYQLDTLRRIVTIEIRSRSYSVSVVTVKQTSSAACRMFAKLSTVGHTVNIDSWLQFGIYKQRGRRRVWVTCLHCSLPVVRWQSQSPTESMFVSDGSQSTACMCTDVSCRHAFGLKLMRVTNVD